uniref:Uncharacterized protein n=1 Tax=Arundo donax TaxID=35708 RepID=A0A0A9HLD7_ARUDO
MIKGRESDPKKLDFFFIFFPLDLI